MSGCFFQHFNRAYGKIWVSFYLNTWKCFFLGVLLNRAPTTQFYPPPPSSTQLHPPPLSSFQPPPSSLQHPQQYLNQNIARNWAISPNLGQKIKNCPILTENWHTWYIGDVNSESRLRFLKSRPQNPFLGKFGPKKSKLSVLSENWYT